MIDLENWFFGLRKKTTEKSFYDFYDVMLYRNDKYLSGKIHTLELIIYYYDLEVCDKLGSEVGISWYLLLYFGWHRP